MKLQLSKEDLLNWLNSQKEYQVLAPIKEGKEYNFGSWDRRTLPDSTYQNTLKPPKDLFFPQHEVLLKYQKNKDAQPLIQEVDLAREKRLILGIRPCDAQSLIILDKVFLNEEYQDPYYRARRENTLIISLVCEKPGPGCFCSDPLSTQGSDILLVDSGDKYLVKLISLQGKSAFENIVFPHNFEIEPLKNKWGSEIASADLTKKLDLIFDSPFWEKLQEKCLNCGVCSFLCPTCHCFDLTDDQNGKKVRSWDSCMFPSFTKQASGHNPRPSGTERLRQRVMHKFKYFPQKYDIFACVGCGRCVEKCPVNLDIREVLLEIKGVS